MKLGIQVPKKSLSVARSTGRTLAKECKKSHESARGRGQFPARFERLRAPRSQGEVRRRDLRFARHPDASLPLDSETLRGGGDRGRSGARHAQLLRIRLIPRRSEKPPSGGFPLRRDRAKWCESVTERIPRNFETPIMDVFVSPFLREVFSCRVRFTPKLIWPPFVTILRACALPRETACSGPSSRPMHTGTVLRTR